MRQIKDIHKGGIPVFLRKVRSLLSVIFLMKNQIQMLAFVPFVILIRLLKPIIVLRFGPLISDRIGHLAANTELYLCEKHISQSEKAVSDFLYIRKPVSNSQLVKMWKRRLKIFAVAENIDTCNRKLPGGSVHYVPMIERGDRDTRDLLSGSRPHLYFTDTELQRGKVFLKKFGIRDKNSFVCFHGRDPHYIRNLARLQSRSHPSKVGSRKHDYRNSDIDSFIPAMEELSDKGYYCFRLGAIVQKSIRTQNSRIVDYACNGMRTEFLDIFLSANCRFLVTDPSGIESVSMIFRVPLIHVNMVPLELTSTYVKDCLFIPKKLWLKNEHRFMTFREIFESGAGRFYHTEKYENSGIVVVQNSPEEIEDVVLEMEARLNGTWIDNSELDSLQEKFWNLFPQSELHGRFRARIGTSFLQRNLDLF